MQRVIAEAVDTGCIFQYPVDVTHVRLEWGELVVMLMSGGDKKAVIVKFGEVAGFRLLDEGDLLEFWPVCAGTNGWLFQINANGWFDHEATRPGFIREQGLGLSEYFIAGQNSCIVCYQMRHPRSKYTQFDETGAAAAAQGQERHRVSAAIRSSTGAAQRHRAAAQGQCRQSDAS